MFNGAACGHPGEAATLRWLEIAVAVVAVVLGGATGPLWSRSDAFPAAPLFAFALHPPPWLDAAAVTVAAGALAWVIGHGLFRVVSRIRQQWRSAARDEPPCLALESASRVWWLFLAAAVVLVVLNQHRWQPWLWEFWLFAALFVTAPPLRVVPFCRMVVLGLYFHSAVSKLDAGFLETHGPQLVDGLLANVGMALPPRGAIRTLAAALLPTGELLVALLLAVPCTRFAGVAGSLLMHLLLLAALGPWGLNHKPSVLLWNAFFLVQNLLLFRGPRIAGERDNARSTAPSAGFSAVDAPHAELRTPPVRLGFAWGIVALAVLLPVAEWFDRIDPWLGWALYASRPARVRVYVKEDVVVRLPEGLLAHLEDPQPLDPWRRLRIDRWSLASRSAPIAPQVRFQMGVILELMRRTDLGDGMRVEWELPADRRTGRRTRRVFEGRTAIESFASEFSLNTEPLPPISAPPRRNDLPPVPPAAR